MQRTPPPSPERFDQRPKQRKRRTEADNLGVSPVAETRTRRVRSEGAVSQSPPRRPLVALPARKRGAPLRLGVISVDQPAFKRPGNTGGKHWSATPECLESASEGDHTARATRRFFKYHRPNLGLLQRPQVIARFKSAVVEQINSDGVVVKERVFERCDGWQDLLNNKRKLSLFECVRWRYLTNKYGKGVVTKRWHMPNMRATRVSARAEHARSVLFF
jgi:hypothetical protein